MQAQKKHIKRARRVSRSTETGAARRAAAAYLLLKYQMFADLNALEDYVELVGEGNTYEDDFEVATLGTSPAMQKGCARCCRRFDRESFVEYVKDGDATVKLTHFYCPNCRGKQSAGRWHNVLRDDPYIIDPPTGVDLMLADGRRKFATGRYEKKRKRAA